MNRPTRIQCIRYAATAVFGMGLLMLGRTAREHHRRTADMAQSLQLLETLQQLDAEAVAVEHRMAAWRQSDARPDTWRALLRELNLEDRIAAQESETELSASGWQLRIAELSGNRLEPAVLESLVNHAQSREHPWRLRSATLTAASSDSSILSVVVRFETPIYRRRYQ